MKNITLITCSCLAILLGIGKVNAQIGAKKEHDARVERLLDTIGLKYQIDSDGDFTLTNQLDSGRTQLFWVNSNTERYNIMEIREVWSIAYISEGLVSSTIMRTLLKDNGSKKLGSWKLTTDKGKECVVFYAQIAANSDKNAFLGALQLVSQAADEMEKQLTGKDDL